MGANMQHVFLQAWSSESVVGSFFYIQHDDLQFLWL